MNLWLTIMGQNVTVTGAHLGWPAATVVLVTVLTIGAVIVSRQKARSGSED